MKKMAWALASSLFQHAARLPECWRCANNPLCFGITAALHLCLLTLKEFPMKRSQTRPVLPSAWGRVPPAPPSSSSRGPSAQINAHLLPPNRYGAVISLLSQELWVCPVRGSTSATCFPFHSVHVGRCGSCCLVTFELLRKGYWNTRAVGLEVSAETAVTLEGLSGCVRPRRLIDSCCQQWKVK